ncbi:hypothetical protein QCA50_003613 [Cerrena zonata]|uniref:Uncharacterized protein n=1 Tax=Cerrena zonata TaxID=2478898 RepID=A0AAW0GQ57_9APHY
MNELLAPSKNILKFTISGTVIVTPRRSPLYHKQIRNISPTHSASSSGDQSDDVDPVLLPRFRVLYSDRETSTTVLSSDLSDSNVDVYAVKGNPSNPQTRKTIVKPGAQAKLSAEGSRIAIRALQPPSSALHPYSSSYRGSSRRGDDSLDEQLGINRSRMTNGNGSGSNSPSSLRQSLFMGASTRLKPKRDGPLIIPSVSAIITPLLVQSQDGEHEGRTDYVVRLTLPAPSDANSEWLEFGLASPSDSSSKEAPSTMSGPPKVEVASASVEGVPVKFDAFAAAKPEKGGTGLDGLAIPFEQSSTREWLTWVKVHIGEAGGGMVQIVYIVRGVKEEESPVPKASWWKGKAKAVQEPTNVLLPTFSLPVTMLEVTLESQAGLDVTSLRSNLSHEQITPAGRRLSQYSLEEFFYPRLAVVFSPTAVPGSTFHSYPSLWQSVQIVALVLPTAAALGLFANQSALTTELSHAKHALHECSSSMTEDCPIMIETITITATETVYTASSESQSRWWHSSSDSSSSTSLDTSISTSTESPTSSLPSSSSSIQPIPLITTIPTVTPTLSTPTTANSPSLPVASQSDALILPRISFPWLVKLDVLQFEIPEQARITITYAFKGLGFAWQIVRKVIHYPLDPPP